MKRIERDNAGMEVEKGDRITIQARGVQVTGKVLYAFWDEESGWMIEMEEANVPGGHSYWKQRTDGGKILCNEKQF